jgi:hypothetical protein
LWGTMRGPDAAGQERYAKNISLLPPSFPSFLSFFFLLQSHQLSTVSSINYFPTSITHSTGNERVSWLLLPLASCPRIPTPKFSL